LKAAASARCSQAKESSRPVIRVPAAAGQMLCAGWRVTQGLGSDRMRPCTQRWRACSEGSSNAGERWSERVFGNVCTTHR